MQQRNTRQIIGFYWRAVRRYPRYLIGLAIFLPLTILIGNFLAPLILANVLSRLSQHQFIEHDIWHSFGTAIILFAILELAGSLIWRFIDYFVFMLEGKVQRDLAHRVFDAMLDQTADFHANHFTGSLVSQTTKLLGAYVRIADTTFFQVSQLVFGLIFTAVFLLPRAPEYVLVLLLVSGFYIAMTFVVSRPVQRAGRKLAAAESEQTGYLADAITNVMTIKSFAGRHYEKRHFTTISDGVIRHLLGFMRVQRKQLNFFSLSMSGLSVLSLLFAIVNVMLYGVNIATVFLIFNYTAYVIGQLFQFSNSSLRSYNRAFGDASDMVAILALQPGVQDPKKPKRLRVARGDIHFDSVVFRHDGANQPIFERLSLHIKPGEKIGLVGHSGSGKTTFTRLLLRFSDVDAGSIRLDGQDISRVAQDDLHTHIAYVPQEPLLFHRSISENIGYGDPAADARAIESVARQAHAHGFIADLPDGYQTLVGERGVKLSGGQRQRVAIARAMLKNAPILVLDEATSALDSESEVLIQDALWKLMRDRTAIVIAHRLSTIQKMDRIIVLDQGRIAEEGSHKELLVRNGTYAKLWQHQSGGFIED